jgi:CRISPR-associated protein Csb2
LNGHSQKEVETEFSQTSSSAQRLNYMSEKPTLARFRVSGSRPLKLTSALFLSERVHLALVELSDGSSIFTGCDSSRLPLQGHGHAYIFCESESDPGAGEITGITVYARMGFGQKEQDALQSLGRVWGPADLEVKLALQEFGRPEDFINHSPLFAHSKKWISRTPFLPGRHAKRTRAGVPKCDERGLQIGSPEHELRRLLALAGLPEQAAVEPVAGTMLGGRQVAWQEFLRRRSGGGPAKTGYGFRIEFQEAVAGPMALGEASHFGMGGFEVDRMGKIEEIKEELRNSW